MYFFTGHLPSPACTSLCAGCNRRPSSQTRTALPAPSIGPVRPACARCSGSGGAKHSRLLRLNTTRSRISSPRSHFRRRMRAVHRVLTINCPKRSARNCSRTGSRSTARRFASEEGQSQCLLAPKRACSRLMQDTSSISKKVTQTSLVCWTDLLESCAVACQS